MHRRGYQQHCCRTHHPPEPHPAPLFVSDRRCCSGSVSRRTPGPVTSGQ
jgi:hypothetical protein